MALIANVVPTSSSAISKNSSDVSGNDTGANKLDLNILFIGMFKSATSGDAAGVGASTAVVRNYTIAQDIAKVKTDIEELGPMENASEAIKGELQNKFSKGGTLNLEASPNIKKLLEVARDKSGDYDIAPPSDIIQKALSGQKISGDETHKLYNWLSDMQLKLIPPDKNLAASNAKLTTLRADQQRVQQLVDSMLQALLYFPKN